MVALDMAMTSVLLALLLDSALGAFAILDIFGNAVSLTFHGL